MSPYCKSAADALADGPLAKLVDEARLLGRVSSVVADVIREAPLAHPALPLHCALQGTTVIITVGTPSQASKLRQRAAALHQALTERLPEVTGMRIRLQPGGSADPVSGTSASDPRASPPPPEPTTENLSAALRFADDLSRDLHDSPLRRSAQRLQASLRTKLARRD